MSGSVQVRQVVAALCRLLTAAGLEAAPPPETFRRAKFGGGPHVEAELLQLLMEVLRASGAASGQGPVEGGELLEGVVAGLWQTGYYADWMYEGGGRSTSRDLLLALGWLLATGTLEKVLSRRVQRLDKTLLTPTRADLQVSSEVQTDATSLRRLQWLVGCLRHQGWSLLSMQEERAALLHAVLFASSTSSPGQSSPLLKEDCVCIQQLCDLLESYLSWKQTESIFWTWMDSVLDSHLTDPLLRRLACAPDGLTACSHGQRGLEALEQMLLTLPGARTHQRRRREQPEDTGQGLQLSTTEDRAFVPRFVPPLPSVPSFLQVYRPTLKTVKCSDRTAEDPTRRSRAPDELPASDAERLLQRTKTLLWRRRQRQRLANRTQIQAMADGLEGLVMIPP